MVLDRSLRITIIGLVIGAALSLVAGWLLRGLLLGVSPADPVTYVAIVLILLAVATLASLIPAHKAAHVDPVVALRAE